MKTYTLLLDTLILVLLCLAINFNVTDDYISNSGSGRRGLVGTMIITWQTLLFVATFCVFLRYIAQKVR